jgi:hypothetical protein
MAHDEGGVRDLRLGEPLKKHSGKRFEEDLGLRRRDRLPKRLRELKSLLKLVFGNGTGSDRPVRGKSITL